MDVQATSLLWQGRLGIPHLVVAWELAENPGGLDDAVAHVHADPDARTYEVEFNFAECDEEEVAVTVVHELLHVALNHIARTAKVLIPEPQWPLFETMLEEDVEGLALALVRAWPE